MEMVNRPEVLEYPENPNYHPNEEEYDCYWIYYWPFSNQELPSYDPEEVNFLPIHSNPGQGIH